MVQASVGGSRQLQSAETDVVQRLVSSNMHSSAGRQNGRERIHDAIGVLPADLRDQKRSHTGAGSATERAAQLETLEAIAAVRLLPHHIQHRVDELCTLGIVSLRSIVVRASLSEHKVVWPEQPSGRSRTDAAHGSRLEVHENRA